MNQIERYGHELGSLARVQRSTLLPLERALVTLSREVARASTQKTSTTFLVDWDLIRGHAFPDLKREVHAGTLEALIRASDAVALKFVVPEGSRREMFRFVLDRVRAQKSRQVGLWAIERDLPPIDGWELPDSMLEALRDLDGREKLLDFMSNRSSGRSTAALVSPGEKKAYLGALRKLQVRYGNRRNEADAINLAQVANLRAMGVPAVLVTGTEALREGFADLTMDPTSALVSLVLRQHFPSNADRERELTRWLAKVQEIVGRLDVVAQVVGSAEKALSPRELRILQHAIGAYESEPVLRTIEVVLRRALLLWRTHIEQSSSTKVSRELHGLSGLAASRLAERKLLSFVDEQMVSSRINLSDIGFRWQAERMQRLTLVDAEDSSRPAILSLRVLSDALESRWPVRVSPGELIDTVQKIIARKWVPRPDGVIFQVVFEDQEEIVYHWRPSRRSVLDRSRILGKGNFRRIRIILKGRELVYWAVGSELGRDAHIVLADGDAAHRWLLAMFRETGLQGLPNESLKRELRRVVGSVGGE